MGIDGGDGCTTSWNVFNTTELCTYKWLSRFYIKSALPQ